MHNCNCYVPQLLSFIRFYSEFRSSITGPYNADTKTPRRRLNYDCPHLNGIHPAIRYTSHGWYTRGGCVDRISLHISSTCLNILHEQRHLRRLGITFNFPKIRTTRLQATGRLPEDLSIALQGQTHGRLPKSPLWFRGPSPQPPSSTMADSTETSHKSQSTVWRLDRCGGY